ncbi:MAG: arsenite efflux transporter metallochaperone ArsD [Hyphomicrobiaceae bacterium]|nr:arsenite efflux transporter metallochaperone ArsD [Hyphomicrobiaceae bacterium]
MTTITVYDPPLCCSTGVCGTEVDAKLAQFAGDLNWLKTRGVEVTRFNLAQEPGQFVENQAVKAILDRSGTDELPAILVGDALVASGRYPSRDELVAMAGLEATLEQVETTEGIPGVEKPKTTTSPCCGSEATQEKSSRCC